MRRTAPGARPEHYEIWKHRARYDKLFQEFHRSLSTDPMDMFMLDLEEGTLDKCREWHAMVNSMDFTRMFGHEVPFFYGSGILKKTGVPLQFP